MELSLESLCPGLQIYQVDRNDEASRLEKKVLFDTLERRINFCDAKAQYKFHAKFNSIPYIVGYASLLEINPNIYGLSILVHPLFQQQNIATTMYLHIIEFAKENENINEIEAMVIPNSKAEKMIIKLNVKIKDEIRFGKSYNNRNVYYIYQKEI